MGIPFYFKSIIQLYPNILSKNLIECDRLFLDFNSIIHICSYEVIQNYKDDIENRIFKTVTDHVDKLLSFCKPKNILYIAVDGVAPLAKQIQQRRRRYLTAFRNTMINEYKDHNSIEYTKWDSNCITPGTDFMKNLDKYLKEFYKDRSNVIISGHEEFGEGEHKIVKYIKSTTDENYTDVIYGLDADLIMLSMICKKKNIYLMRESSKFGDIKLEYLDIDMLSDSIVAFFEKDDCLFDYVFICFLLGNDFIPGLQFLKLKSNGLDIIVKIYKNLKNPLIIKKKDEFYVDKEGFCELLEQLSKNEEDCMKEVYSEYYKLEYRSMSYFKTKYDKFVHEFDHYPIIYKYDINLINPINNPKWRENYYHELFQSDDIKKITNNYIEGILWNANYYFNMKFDIGWHYKFNYAPCIIDLLKYSYASDIIQMQTELKKSYFDLNAEKQLLTVIPPLSIDIVPAKLRPIMMDVNNGCLHYYPNKFCLSTYLKYALHECIPLIPNIHFPTLYNQYDALMKNQG